MDFERYTRGVIAYLKKNEESYRMVMSASSPRLFAEKLKRILAKQFMEQVPNRLFTDDPGKWQVQVSFALSACVDVITEYGVVDMAMVRQDQGPEGTAALEVVAPVFHRCRDRFGCTGGSFLGRNSAFSVSDPPVLRRGRIAYGAGRNLYAPIRYVFPLFLFNQMLAAFLRNDNDPGLATFGVLAGGIFNMFGDYFFVFACDMGIFGTGLATAIGAGISFLVMLTHFVKRKNTLRPVRPEHFLSKLCEISVTGFSTFFIDVAMGILTVLFNRQIMKYLDANALAIYGPIINISTYVQCCAYSVGQTSLPNVSANFGAGRRIRIRKTLRPALWATVFFGVFWTALSMICPNLYIRIFMNPTPEIPDAAPANCPQLRAVVSSAAVQYFFRLLFSVDHGTGSGICRVGGTRACHRRHSDFGTSRPRRGVVLAVCHAGHETAGHGLCRNHDREIYKSSAGSVPCRGLTHGDRWIPGEA